MRIKFTFLFVIALSVLALGGMVRSQETDAGFEDRVDALVDRLNETTSEKEKVIYFAFYEGADREIVEETIEMAREQLYGVPIVLLDETLPLPEEAYEKVRDKYYAGRMTELLADGAPDNSLAYIAFTDKDIFVGRRPHVRGLANPELGVAIVSTKRLYYQSSRYRYKLRVLKEILHEAGHLFGMEHCEGVTYCVMSFSYDENKLDAKYREFCPYHKHKLMLYLKAKGVDLEKYKLKTEEEPSGDENE